MEGICPVNLLERDAEGYIGLSAGPTLNRSLTFKAVYLNRIEQTMVAEY